MGSIESILKKNSGSLPYLFAALAPKNDISVLERLSRMVTGPVLFSYVWWILQNAVKKKIHTLYFLARDGYVLRAIANLFCQRFGLDLDCRYLYISRASLRMPTYYFIGEEAYDLLFQGSYHVTPFVVLQRVGFSKEERQILYERCSLSVDMEHVRLSCAQLQNMRDILRQDSLYRGRVEERSRAALTSALGYMKQEGLLDPGHIAIIDSGWNGSLQRSLRQLLERGGGQFCLTGYYFGMYVDHKEEQDGEYLTWYFNRHSTTNRKARFCSDLFECMLSAPHGMTIGYQTDGNSFFPILGTPPSPEMIEQIHIQQQGILTFVQDAVEQIQFNQFQPEQHLDLTQSLLQRLMERPAAKEAAALGNFTFCDDIIEEKFNSLASPVQIQTLKNYLLLRRIWRKLRKSTPPQTNLFWPYGIAAFLGPFRREWYILNIRLWEWLKYTLK